MDTYSHKPFNGALADVLIEREGSAFKLNLSAFAREVEGYSDSAIRMIVNGERRPTPEALEAIAKALHLSPHYFREYRIQWVTRLAYECPEIIDQLYGVARLYAELHQAECDSLAAGLPALDVLGGKTEEDE
jgi:transcriptional regulator with XRE-family HTH domain